jgi:hypothetical protein
MFLVLRWLIHIEADWDTDTYHFEVKFISDFGVNPD